MLTSDQVQQVLDWFDPTVAPKAIAAVGYEVKPKARLEHVPEDKTFRLTARERCPCRSDNPDAADSYDQVGFIFTYQWLSTNLGSPGQLNQAIADYVTDWAIGHLEDDKEEQATPKDSNVDHLFDLYARVKVAKVPEFVINEVQRSAAALIKFVTYYEQQQHHQMNEETGG